MAKNSRLLRVLLVVTALCLPASAAVEDREFNVSGIGIAVGVNRLWNHVPSVAPVHGWYDPGDIAAVFIYRLFPCSGWFCKSSMAGTASINLQRLEQPDNATDASSEAHLRLRMATVRKNDERRTSSSQDASLRKLRANFDTLRYTQFENGTWATFKVVNLSGDPIGATYYRMLGDDMQMVVNFNVTPSQLPPTVSLMQLHESFESFVRGIKIDGQTNKQRTR